MVIAEARVLYRWVRRDCIWSQCRCSRLIRLPFVPAFIEKPPLDRALAELGRPGRDDRFAGRTPVSSIPRPVSSVHTFHPSTSSRTTIIGAERAKSSMALTTSSSAAPPAEVRREFTGAGAAMARDLADHQL